jgi:type IV secretory pathway protease TraF
LDIVSHMQRIFISLIAFLIILSLTTYILYLKGYGFIYQYSQSVTPGYYWFAPIKNYKNLKKGDKVLIKLNSYWDSFLAKRNYKQKNIPLIKQIYATSGDKICERNNYLYINNVKSVPLAKVDSIGRRLPHYFQTKGCQQLKPGQVLPLGLHVANSFDGRYFGPVAQSEVQSRVYHL